MRFLAGALVTVPGLAMAVGIILYWSGSESRAFVLL